MPRATAQTLTALLLAGLLSGCANSPPSVLSDGPATVGVADRFSNLLQTQCPIPSGMDEKPLREARLLRAEWLTAVLARYGSARIEDYSGDKRTDAAMLLTRINDSVNVIKRARAELVRDPNLFEIYRADLVVALLGTANAAIAPSIRTVSGFVLKPNPADGINLLEGFFKDRLYAQAYSQTCTEFMQATTVPDTHPVIRKQIRDHLIEQCGKIVRQSGLDTRCADPGV